MISTARDQRVMTLAVVFASIVCLIVSPWVHVESATAAAPVVRYTGLPQSVDVSSWAQTEEITRDNFTVNDPPPPAPPAVKKAAPVASAPNRNVTAPRRSVPWSPAPSPGSAKATARDMVSARGWGADQYSCLASLWDRESRWNASAQNSSSGAYGIPQALPGSKMASAGADWATNPATQIRWGLGYISDRYGTPCGAWSHSEAHGWY